MSFLVFTPWDQFVDLVAFTGFVAQAVIWQWMRWEVNRVLPPHRRTRFWRNPWEGFTTYSLHKEFFPMSRLRFALELLMVVWLPFAIAGYFRLHHAIDSWLDR